MEIQGSRCQAGNENGGGEESAQLHGGAGSGGGPGGACRGDAVEAGGGDGAWRVAGGQKAAKRARTHSGETQHEAAGRGHDRGLPRGWAVIFEWERAPDEPLTAR